jgi:hypothetical protein
MEKNIVIDALRDQLVFDIYDFEQYKILFNDDPNQIAVMKSVADSFFLTLKRYYWDRFVINISRITDPVCQNGNNNLSIELLCIQSKTMNLNCYDTIYSNVEQIKLLAKPFRKSRNKIVGHLDLKHAIKESFLDECEDAFYRIENIYILASDSIDLFYNEKENTTYLLSSLSMPGDASSLIYNISSRSIK